MRTRSSSDDPEMFDSSDLRALRHRIDTTYDDMRRLILLAAIFFLVGILVIMARLQVATEDIFRWAPVIWLLGVVVAGTFMNLFLQCARFFSKRRKRRTRRASISSSHLSSLFGNFPNSFPCLAPSPHVGCCRDPARRIARDLSESKESLPAYEDIVQSPSTESPPPAYEEAMLSRLSIFSSPFKRTQPLYCPVHGKISRSTTLVQMDSPANPLSTIVDETSQCTFSNQSNQSPAS
ncbi:unnamed protein product, partial [Mesorhabditis belari]|uniref:Uncharacterized protein n=1 Tax=Mesorhabditis belari TaxID=2138241 RepID=A0AAF3FCC1_9BILA